MAQTRNDNILEAGETCWRVEKADRAAVLIDGASYYAALRASLLEARHSVFIVGWDIDSRTRLVGPSGTADDGYPEPLGAFLTALVNERPGLQIHLLLWDYTMLYALDREPLPSINLAWRTPPQISVCLDNVLPVGASHHQKVVVIDDAVAYCGGFDLTSRRWDTAGHDLNDDRRTDPSGVTYRPFHDIQMAVDGKAAAALGELVRERWRTAACETPMPPKPAGNPWPAHVDPDFTDIEIGIARTSPAYDGNPEIREVEALFLRSIDAAERSIYIECQYLTADRVGERLARRMRENDSLETLIVAPNVHQSWLEEHSMTVGRCRFMKRLEAAGVSDRVRLLYPAIPGDIGGEGVMVHAKCMIVDDRLLRVGSANLNNRSMGMDTECDLVAEARDETQRATIAAVRNRLLAEHLDTAPDKVAKAMDEHGSLLSTVDSLSHGERRLQPIELDDAEEDEFTRTVGQLADPECPVTAPAFVGDMFGAQADSVSPARRIAKLFALATLVLGFVAVWRYTPLAEYTDPKELQQWLERLNGDYWMPVVMPLAYVLGGLIVFPVTALIAVTSMMFDPLTALLYALGGSLLSAAVTFWIGHTVGRNPLRGWMGPRVNRISRRLARSGVLSVAALRMVPIAPFSIINVVAGASHVGFADYMLGTFAGMTPGILIICYLGHQVMETLANPNMQEVLLLLAGVVAWFLMSIMLQRLASKLNPEIRDGTE